MVPYIGMSIVSYLVFLLIVFILSSRRLTDPFEITPPSLSSLALFVYGAIMLLIPAIIVYCISGWRLSQGANRILTPLTSLFIGVGIYIGLIMLFPSLIGVWSGSIDSSSAMLIAVFWMLPLSIPILCGGYLGLYICQKIIVSRS